MEQTEPSSNQDAGQTSSTQAQPVPELSTVAEEASMQEQPSQPGAQTQPPDGGESPSKSSPAKQESIPPELTRLLKSADKSGQPPPSTSGRPKAPADLQELRFYSWWYEDMESNDLTFRVDGNSVAGGGLAKRYVTLDFDVGTRSFTIRSATDGQELVVPGLLGVTTAAGAMVEVWDLFVGSTLDILGRSVTLLKADGNTALWLDYHGKRLKKLRADLHAELQKYKPRAHPNALVFDRGDRSAAGGLSLRYIVDQINAMLDDLAQYRPQKTEAFRARIALPSL